MFLDIDRHPAARAAAIDEHGGVLTYGALNAFCGEMAAHLPARALLFNLCENTFGSLCGYVCAEAAGAVPLLLAADIDVELRGHLIETYRPEFVWAPVSMDLGLGEPVFSIYDYTLYRTNERSPRLNRELALLLTTSGSTGSPKLVRQSAKNILSNAWAIREYLEITDAERPITTLPMNYTYGLSVINSHLLAGATLLMTTKGFMQKEFWQFFKEQGATSIAGVPYNYEMLKKLRFFSMELPSLVTMTQAGGKLTPELHKEFAQYANDTGRRFFVMYGQTEATARMSYLPYERSFEKYGSMGLAIPGGEFSLIDVNGKTIETTDVVGELVYEGPNVTLGYAVCAEDLEKGDEWQGRLVTGDMAKRDADGFYYIVGRKKRFLKMFGNRVNLDECERMLKTALDEDCACSGRDDLMTVFVTDAKLIERAQTFLATKTGLHHSAFDVRFIAAIPKSDAGKTLYKELPL